MQWKFGRAPSHHSDLIRKGRQRKYPVGRTRIKRRDLRSHSPRENHDQGQTSSRSKRPSIFTIPGTKLSEQVTGSKGVLVLSISAMDSGSQTPLTPKERIELIRGELESIRASTNQLKWDNLKFEMEDIKDELSDEIHAGLKDAANLMGNLGQRLCNLEQKVEELTTAFGKISEASAEATTSTGNKGKR
jgi:hypothetical protein